MALRKVQSGAIADNAITSAKIASGAVTAADLNSDVSTVINNVTVDTVFTGDSITLPAGTTAQRPISADPGMLRFNTSFGKLEQYDGSGWAAIDSPPIISGVTTSIFTNSTDTITINGSNFSIDCTVSLIAADGATYSPTTVVRNSSSSLTITPGSSLVTIGQTSGKDPFDIKVTNAGGLSVTFPAQINYNPNPVWSTTAGSLSTVYDIMRSGFTTSVSASSLDPDDTISYSITSGSLPTGMSLNTSTGAITGTPNAVGSDTTSNFTIRASNGSQTSDRAFSITIKAPIVQAFSYTGSDQSFTVPSTLTALSVKMWGAGGGGSFGEGRAFAGGPGGYTYGVINTNTMKGQALTVRVGQGGPQAISTSQPAPAYPNGGRSGRRTNYNSGYGGGRSEIMFGSIDLLVAGAGGGAAGTGGSSDTPTSGGPGGGTTGGFGWYGYQGSTSYGGQGGTQSAGGANGIAVSSSITAQPGYKQGGSTDNSLAWDNGGPNAQAGGGDGYYGGGIGSPHSGGGGGSSYANSTYVSNADLQRTAADGSANNTNPPNTGDAQYNGSAGKTGNNSPGNNGYVVLIY
jgi:hypothetical protein